MSLHGSVAIVTGSTRGIGRGIARRLASEGAKVAINARDPRAVEAMTIEMQADGASVIGVAADVGLAADVDRLFAAALDAFGQVDVLVNNAAVTGPDALRPLLEIDEAHWTEVIRTNLTGPALCTTRAARLMVDRGRGGVIVNVSSFSAARSHRAMAAYDAAKGGIEAFTRAAALDLAPHGIRVNAVGPGAIRVEADDRAEPSALAERARTVPLGRLGTPHDIAAAVAFLASKDAEYITGQVLYVDGGMLAQLRSPQVDPGNADRQRS